MKDPALFSAIYKNKKIKKKNKSVPFLNIYTASLSFLYINCTIFNHF